MDKHDAIIKTWAWDVQEDPSLPKPDFPGFFCADHAQDRELTPFVYAGETLYVCRRCGNVYQLIGAADGGNRLKLWPKLLEQPYQWKTYLKAEGTLSRDFLLCEGGIRRHPFFDAHGGKEAPDAAECLVRYLLSLCGDEHRNPFFNGQTGDCRVEWTEDGCLSITEGEADEPYPLGQFHRYRESADQIFFESSQYDYFILDEEFEIWDDVRCEIRYLGEDESKVPEGLERSAPRRFDGCESWVSHEPFGLRGDYLFQCDYQKTEEDPEG